MRHTKSTFKLIGYLGMCGSLLFSCTTTRFLAENESFYEGAEITIESEGKLADKKTAIRQMRSGITAEPNTRIFGMRPGVWFYYSADPEKEKGLKNWLKDKLGEEPVLLEDIDPERTARVLQRILIDNGYFDARVRADTETKDKKSTVTYTATLSRPFRFGQIHFPPARDSAYRHVISEVAKGSYLSPGDQYSLDVLKEERSRIETQVENYGFFYFDDEYITYEADSTVGNKRVDIYLKLKPDMPPEAKWIYTLNEVNVLSDFSISGDTVAPSMDTLLVDDFIYVRKGKSKDFKPRIITDVINLRKGNIYTREAHDYTLSHLMGLGTFKFVNIKYEDTPGDSASLDASIFLTPLLKKSLRFETQLTSKSNNFVGPGVGITFTNRNFLRGAEQFNLNINTSYEFQVSSQQQGPLNAFELNVESSLDVPRLVSPIPFDVSGRYLPTTKYRVGYNLQSRVGYFRLNSFNAAYGYIWQETAAKRHELYISDLTYVKVGKTSEEFDEILEDNAVLANSFQDQFIIGGYYSFTFNTQFSEKWIRKFGPNTLNPNNFYFNANLKLAGNVIHTIHRVFTDRKDSLELFGQPYSQYIIGDIDFRYYWDVDSRNRIATRLILGVGYPYGNSYSLPYIKQFTAGGTNSIRAFPARSLGPGSYNVRTDPSRAETDVFFIDQRGDIKIESSLEYRFGIIGWLKGALFVDAGNIWLLNEDESRPGGQFDWQTFQDQIAVGTGAGLRLDFNFFVLRFDLAFPIRKPFLPEGERWVLDEISFGRSQWRRENLVFNLAIGYPF